MKKKYPSAFLIKKGPSWVLSGHWVRNRKRAAKCNSWQLPGPIEASYSLFSENRAKHCFLAIWHWYSHRQIPVTGVFPLSRKSYALFFILFEVVFHHFSHNGWWTLGKKFMYHCRERKLIKHKPRISQSYDFSQVFVIRYQVVEDRLLSGSRSTPIGWTGRKMAWAGQWPNIIDKTSVICKKRALDIHVKPADQRELDEDYSENSIDLDWKIESFKSDTLIIQVSFKDPLLISPGVE